MDIVKRLENILVDALEKIGVKRDGIYIEIPNDTSHGDYSSNIAMQLSKELKKNPRDIAEEIVNNLENIEEVEKVEIAGPGFINFHLSNKYLLDVLGDVLEEKDEYGKNNSLEGKRVIVEYTDVNLLKPMHIGHLYSNNVGESLSRLLEASGADVKRACYQSDIGLQVGKTLWGLQEILGRDNKAFEELTKESLMDRVYYLGDAYAYGNDFYSNKKDAAAIKEIERINRYIFSLFVEIPAEEFNEFEEKNLKKTYEIARQWCLDYFDIIYEKVGTEFSRIYSESEIGGKGLEVVLDNVGKVFEKDDGAIIYRGDPKKGLHTRVFVNRQGMPTYEAKEIGLALLKNEESGFDESIMITADEQSGYFKVVLDALSQIYPDLARKMKHMPHGKILSPDGKKMSSRKGGILSAGELIEDTQKKVLEVMKEKDEDTAEKIAIAAIKYAYLRVAVGRDIAFDLDQAISFDGETGSYLLYVYARCNSILKDAKEEGELSEEILQEPFVQDLVKQISKYPQVVLDSTKNYSPSTMCQYLFDLGQTFNAFYQNVNVLNSENKKALIPVLEATKQVMKNGLNILGINTVAKM
jgi:arginyl-tRNA synthetase